MSKNVFGNPIKICSTEPLTGYFRDGCCNTDEEDIGVHTVCARVTQEFLEFSREQGNDLMTPNPDHHFDGLKPGDRWCLCASRWYEAYKAGVAPPIDIEATHEKTLDIIPMQLLIDYAEKSKDREE